jgi:serine/threonine protein kinase
MQALPRIAGYELYRCLGGGPLTRVFSATESATDTACAVKVLRAELQEQPTAVKLFQREARAGLAVSHPHLVRLRHAHATRPPYYLVMDLLPGEPLRRRLRREYRLELPSALWVARQTAEALAALHRAGFVHGDVKPENVRLIDDGTAILIDLGFAHRPGENAHLLNQGYVLGTVNYLAPELCGPDFEDGLAADLFSIGVMLFEMLTGRLPYPAGTIEQTFRRHGSDPPADVRRFAGALPAALVRLIHRLLSHKPADRPRAGAVVQQLIALEIAALRQRKAA